MSESDLFQSQMFSDKIQTSEDDSGPENNYGAVELEAVESYQDEPLAHRLRPKKDVNKDRCRKWILMASTSPLVSQDMKKKPS